MSTNVNREHLTYAVEAITDAYTNPTAHITMLPPEQRYRMLRGFRVEIQNAEIVDRDRRLNERQCLIQEYRQDARELHSLLADIGINPLGITPRLAFERLCNESDLIRIRPDNESRILLDVAQLRERIDRGNAAFSVFGLGPAAIGIGFYANLVMQQAGVALPMAILAGGLSGMLALVVLDCVRRTLAFPLRALKIDHWPAGKRAQWIKSAGGYRAVEEWNSDAYRFVEKDAREPVEIRLPDPPADVAATLSRLASANIPTDVATVPEAISFARPLSHILIESKRKHDALMREMRAALDPIIYVEHGSAVALVAQFGDFPVERTVIDRVAQAVRLI